MRYAPDAYDVTAPLDLTQKPNVVTRWKLGRASPDQCFAALNRAGAEFERLPDQQKGEGCGFENVALLNRSTISWGGGITLTCPMLAGLYLWEQYEVQPAAAALYDSKVIRIKHFGAYACRNINNAKSGRRSEHAQANAVDVAGFVLDDGTEISVLKDWKVGLKGRFLEKVRGGACARFNTVLGPDYNAAHRNHFHFDDGRNSICR